MRACLQVINYKTKYNATRNNFFLRFYNIAFIGESIPVSKLPITDQALNMLDLSTVNVDPEIAKHFLFSGTKLVRVRKAKNISGDNQKDDEGMALAMVVRIGS